MITSRLAMFLSPEPGSGGLWYLTISAGPLTAGKVIMECYQKFIGYDDSPSAWERQFFDEGGGT